jgi:hypothetical protein
MKLLDLLIDLLFDGVALIGIFLLEMRFLIVGLASVGVVGCCVRLVCVGIVDGIE